MNQSLVTEGGGGEGGRGSSNMSPTCQDANLRVLRADPQNCLSMVESVEARLCVPRPGWKDS